MLLLGKQVEKTQIYYSFNIFEQEVFGKCHIKKASKNKMCPRITTKATRPRTRRPHSFVLVGVDVKEEQNGWYKHGSTQ